MYLSAPSLVSSVHQKTETSYDQTMRTFQVQSITMDIIKASIALREKTPTSAEDLPLLQAVEHAQLLIRHLSSIEAERQDLSAFRKAYQSAISLLDEYRGPNRADIAIMKAGLIEGALIVADKAAQNEIRTIEIKNRRELVEMVRDSSSLWIRDHSENKQRDDVLDSAYYLSNAALSQIIKG
jgi:hypothetical protein